MELFDYMLGVEQGKKSGGGGYVYTSIVDNGDGTITATDKDGVEHTIAYTFDDDGKIMSVSLDGKLQTVTYDENGVLTSIGSTDVDIETLPVIEEGASLNIAYGDTAPQDTSKLWIKANEPSNLEFGYNLENGVESIQSLSTTLPYGRQNMGYAVLGDKIYLFGGDNSDWNVGVTTINIFDTKTNTISTLSTELTTRQTNISCATVNDKIYLFGGYSSNDNGLLIQVFNPTTKSLEVLSTKLSRFTQNAAVEVFGNKVYLFGGNYSNTSKMNNIDVFDTENESISTVSYLPRGADGITSAIVGSKIYLFGGNVSGGATLLDTINVFDIETNTISTLSTKLPVKTYGMSSATIGNKVYLFDHRNKSIYGFNTETNDIFTLSTTLLRNSNFRSSGLVGNKIYMIGGGYYQTDNRYIDVFTLTFPLTNGDIFVQEDFTKKRFDILSSPTKVSISVRDVLIGNENNEAEKAEAYLYNEDSEEWELI